MGTPIKFQGIIGLLDEAWPTADIERKICRGKFIHLLMNRVKADVGVYLC